VADPVRLNDVTKADGPVERFREYLSDCVRDGVDAGRLQGGHGQQDRLAAARQPLKPAHGLRIENIERQPQRRPRVGRLETSGLCRQIIRMGVAEPFGRVDDHVRKRRRP
jgi:hypothetical protein